MKDVFEYSLKKLNDAYQRLEEGVKQTKDELDQDGVIQRFEFTFELLWKALKLYLEHQGIIVKTPRESLVEAFRINLIIDEKIFLDMLEDRNNTSHIYDKATSNKIFNRIKKKYLSEIAKIVNLLKARLQELPGCPEK